MATLTPIDVFRGNPPSNAHQPNPTEVVDLLDDIKDKAYGRPMTSLALGQSNMKAVGGSSGGDQAPSKMVYLLNSSSAGATYSQGTSFNVGAFGTKPLNIGSAGNWANNIGFHFAKAMSVRTKSEQYQIQVAMGAHAAEAFISASDLASNGWTRPGGDEDLNSAMHVALETALPLVPGEPDRLDFVIIHQGEANLGDQVEVFARKWLTVIEDLESAGYVDDQTVIVFGELCPVAANTYARRHLNALKRLQMARPNIRIARSTGLEPHTEGNVHFSGESLARFGVRYAAAALGAQEPEDIDTLSADLSVDGGLGWAMNGGSTNTSNFDLASRLPRDLDGVPAITEDADLGWCYVQPANTQLILPSRRIYRVPEAGLYRCTYEIKVLDDPGTVDCRLSVYEWDEDRNYIGANNVTPVESPVAVGAGRVVITGTFGRAGMGGTGTFSTSAKWFVPTFYAGAGNDDASFAFNILDMRIESYAPSAITNFNPHRMGDTLQIASGAVSVTSGFHAVNTEGGAASDDLATINTTGIPDGALLTLTPSHTDRTVVLKDTGGNLKLAGDFSMDGFYDSITLRKTGANWLEIARSDNAA